VWHGPRVDGCPHAHLTMLTPSVQPRLRCRRCHLTIAAEELKGGPCPECLEADGARRRDFETIEVTTGAGTRFRCEDCGLMLEDGPDPS